MVLSSLWSLETLHKFVLRVWYHLVLNSIM
jgi:hypothetical protein